MHIDHTADVEFRPDDAESVLMSPVGYLRGGWLDEKLAWDWQPFVSGDGVPVRRLAPLVGRSGEVVVRRRGRELDRFRGRLHRAAKHRDRYPNALFLRLAPQAGRATRSGSTRAPGS